MSCYATSSFFNEKKKHYFWWGIFSVFCHMKWKLLFDFKAHTDETPLTIYNGKEWGRYVGWGNEMSC